MPRGRPRKSKSPDCEVATRGYVKRIANEAMDHKHHIPGSGPFMSLVACFLVVCISFAIAIDTRLDTGEMHIFAVQILISSLIGLLISFDLVWGSGNSTHNGSPSYDLSREISPRSDIEDDLENIRAPCSK